jgi:hypothetical protein
MRKKGRGDYSSHHRSADGATSTTLNQTEDRRICNRSVTKGRETKRAKIRFVTYSLIYPEMSWVQLIGMEKQWERARSECRDWCDGVLRASTKNVSGLVFRDETAAASSVGSRSLFDGKPSQPRRSDHGSAFKAGTEVEGRFRTKSGRHVQSIALFGTSSQRIL